MFQKVSLPKLREVVRNDRTNLYIAARGGEYGRPMIFLHWSAGHYGSFFPDYDINIDADGSLMMPDLSLADADNHCWRRNAGAVGVSLACCVGAVCKTDPLSPDDIDFGSEPPTPQQIEAMARAVAVLCDLLGLPCTFEYVRTHCEQAAVDGYGPGSGDSETRWDLAFLPGFSETGGDLIRGKAIWYLENGMGA